MGPGAADREAEQYSSVARSHLRAPQLPGGFGARPAEPQRHVEQRAVQVRGRRRRRAERGQAGKPIYPHLSIGEQIAPELTPGLFFCCKTYPKDAIANYRWCSTCSGRRILVS